MCSSDLDAALRGQPLTVHGDGTQSRDFTYVDTVTSVIADAVQRGVSDPEPVNLAYGSRVTLLEVIAQLEAMLGRPLERVHTPTRAGDVPHSQADSTRVNELFGHIAPTPFAAGLRATVDWMSDVTG